MVAGAGSCNYMDNDFFLAVSQAQPGKESFCLVISLVSPAIDQNYAQSRCSACVCRLKECARKIPKSFQQSDKVFQFLSIFLKA